MTTQSTATAANGSPKAVAKPFVKGLDGIVAVQTEISSVDGPNSTLLYRGININELAEQASYEEVAYLLLNGHLPGRSELADFNARLVANRWLPAPLYDLLRTFPRDTVPMEALRVAVRVGDERVAQVGHPLDAGRALDSGADEVDRARRRGREDDVDPLLADDPACGGDRGQVPGHARVGYEQPARGHLGLDERALEPVRGAQLLGRLARARAEVAHTVHPGLRRHEQVRIAVHPLRVLGREHVGLDAERRQVLRELQRALHAAAARGREVHGDEQHLHRREA